MVEGEKKRFLANEIMGKDVISKSSGKLFGKVEDIVFETRTGEIIFILLDKPTSFAASFELEKDNRGKYQIPFNAVLAVGDMVVVAEEDIL